MDLIKINKPKKYYFEDYMQDIREEMNSMFKNAFESMGLAEEISNGKHLSFRPPVELREHNGNYELKVQLPGINKENIDVEVKEDSITIKAETEERKEEKGENIYKSEFRYGKFTRNIPLPSEIESENVEAEFKDGILKITAPKSKEEQEKIKHITVK